MFFVIQGQSLGLPVHQGKKKSVLQNLISARLSPQKIRRLDATYTLQAKKATVL
jgi:hypothetical protein